MSAAGREHPLQDILGAGDLFVGPVEHVGGIEIVGWDFPRKAAARLGIRIIETHVGGAASLAGRWRGRCDAVLVDAPCSNLGVLLRNPDVKWRRTPDDLHRLQAKQQTIVAAAASMVKPGGRLVYATCSLLREEDEAQAEAFLAAEPEFSVVPAARAWNETIGGLSPGGERYLRLTPARHGTDGFFVAIFERKPCPTAS